MRSAQVSAAQKGTNPPVGGQCIFFFFRNWRHCGIKIDNLTGRFIPNNSPYVRSISTNHLRRRTRAALSHPNSKAAGFADQLQHRTESKGPDDPT